jgi:hypothetical protein
MKKPKMSFKRLFEESEGHYAGTAQDIDMIKHNMRRIHWMLSSIVAFFKITVEPDILDDAINPSDQYIHSIIREARFASTPARQPVDKKRKAKKHK